MSKTLYRRRAQSSELPRNTDAANDRHHRFLQPPFTGRLPKHKAKALACGKAPGLAATKRLCAAWLETRQWSIEDGVWPKLLTRTSFQTAGELQKRLGSGHFYYLFVSGRP